ncbi:hypothetical protein JAAARDRAFT_30690 [Jaapia argillacea MUCL 33604]|uniref:Secreted protein n=1 Tax=Jaapia argillacea MUCL 33604 TaxID=933084 RepID=A0A067Q6V5_9AGAM|nr:hypothetical protein JAAARDRAFT_30690 [Jaapia argillacea MUCL 33604]
MSIRSISTLSTFLIRLFVIRAQTLGRAPILKLVSFNSSVSQPRGQVLLSTLHRVRRFVDMLHDPWATILRYNLKLNQRPILIRKDSSPAESTFS